MTLYFAYGSNMDRRQMARRCPGATVLGTITLDGWRFSINQRGVANILPDPAGRLVGLLWSLGAGHEAVLDDYVGVDDGHFVREWLDLPGHGQALVYIATDSNIGRPRPGYLERILAAAKAEDLPGWYVEELAGWGD